MRYLRNARFAKVRIALLRAEPDDSVTVIAMACGFTHMSRFALEYRQRFGERPSDTLRRAGNGRENVRGGGLAGSANPLVQGLPRSVVGVTGRFVHNCTLRGGAPGTWIAGEVAT